MHLHLCALILTLSYYYFISKSLFYFLQPTALFFSPFISLSCVFLLRYLVSNIYSSATSRAISDEDIDADEVGFTGGNIRVPLMRKEPRGN